MIQNYTVLLFKCNNAKKPQNRSKSFKSERKGTLNHSVFLVHTCISIHESETVSNLCPPINPM